MTDQNPKHNRGHRHGSRPSEGQNAPQNVRAHEEGEPARGEVHLRGMQSLERLRDRVDLATREIRRLREENVALAERVRALEEHGAILLDTALSEMDDSEILRRKLAGFIEAVDRYIERENEADAAGTAGASHPEE